MSTTVSNALSRKNPRERLTIAVDPSQFWDATNKRWKSGVLAVNITGIAWTNTTGTAEKVRVRAAAADYSPDHDAAEHEGDYTTGSGSGSVGSINWTQNVSLNYGQCGPSSRRAPDGTFDLVYVDLELVEGELTAVTDLAATVTYTVTPTYIDPTVTFSGGSVQTHDFTLKVAEKRPIHFGAMITGTGIGSYSHIACQLVSLSTAVKRGRLRRAHPPARLVASTAGEARAVLANHHVSPANGGGMAYKETFTWVFAVNGGKPDRCASEYQYYNAPMTTHYAFLSVGLVKDRPTDDVVTATLSTRLYFA